MSAMVYGKRSFFDDLQSPSPTSPSTPVSKKLRCSSTSPRRFSPPPPAAVSIDHLRALFPDVDCQFLEKALEECGNDLDVAIKRLHELHLSHAHGKSVSASEADGEMDGGMYKCYVRYLSAD
uniref:CUE domain-containing protein n=1 Tax=Solanum tuberosum TaxID=4113 RepID=M1CS11_SOLTU